MPGAVPNALSIAKKMRQGKGMLLAFYFIFIIRGFGVNVLIRLPLVLLW